MAGCRKQDKKDNHGIKLKPGEDQLKNGSYRYRYTDRDGKRYSIYSPWLRAQDVPKNAQGELSLREKIAEIEEDKKNGISSAKRRTLTLNDAFEDFMKSKSGVRQSTINTYNSVYDTHVRDALGQFKIADILFSDIMNLYNRLVDNGTSIAVITNVNTILHPIFDFEIRNRVLTYNPVTGALKEIKQNNHYSANTREALTIPEQTAFINFVASSSEYNFLLPMITVFLGTGMRIGEISGLQWNDCDFKNRTITVRHNLTYYPVNGQYEFHMSEPKSQKGKREIPMLPEVKTALLTERKKQFSLGGCRCNIDGFDSFVFTNHLGKPYPRSSIDGFLKRIVRDYNKRESEKAYQEHREPLLLPNFSAHVLRHTFATRFCENEDNLKIIQDILGHASGTTTMNVYLHATQQAKQDSFKNLEGKIKLA